MEAKFRNVLLFLYKKKKTKSNALSCQNFVSLFFLFLLLFLFSFLRSQNKNFGYMATLFFFFFVCFSSVFPARLCAVVEIVCLFSFSKFSLFYFQNFLSFFLSFYFVTLLLILFSNNFFGFYFFVPSLRNSSCHASLVAKLLKWIDTQALYGTIKKSDYLGWFFSPLFLFSLKTSLDKCIVNFEKWVTQPAYCLVKLNNF